METYTYCNLVVLSIKTGNRQSPPIFFLSSSISTTKTTFQTSLCIPPKNRHQDLHEFKNQCGIQRFLQIGKQQNLVFRYFSLYSSIKPQESARLLERLNPIGRILVSSHISKPSTMVSSQLTVLLNNESWKSSKDHLKVIPSNHLEFDFSDVFGPISESTCQDSDNVEVIYDQSHSLVGPSPRVSQSLGLSKLTIREELDIYEEPLLDEKCVKVERVGIEDFEVMRVVGRGAFGKVYQVRKRDTSDIYAMKVVRKDKILEKNHAEYMKAERDILTKIDHPFVVQLRYSFQTKYRLYLVLDFVNGGHLFFQLHRHGLFREDLARVYAAEIVSAVSHLHANGIMHRDLKPENILLDADGHALLTDFGLAKEFDGNGRSNSLCGTVEYMSPEIILGKGHDKAADWWSVGVLLYEMLTGQPPFRGGNREKIQQKIVKEKMKLPAFLSSEAHSLLKALLQKDPSKRLGSGAMGSDEVKHHKWFKPINWKKLEAREIQPSFRPEVAGNHCVANFDKCWTDMPLTDSPASSPHGSTTFFQRFTYVKPAAYLLEIQSPVC